MNHRQLLTVIQLRGEVMEVGQDTVIQVTKPQEPVLLVVMLVELVMNQAQLMFVQQ